jgi:hypothetical protein
MFNNLLYCIYQSINFKPIAAFLIKPIIFKEVKVLNGLLRVACQWKPTRISYPVFPS